MDISEYYGDRDNCINELSLARKKWGSTTTTVEEWDGVEKALGFMALYCPEDLCDHVNAAVTTECNWRRMVGAYHTE